MKKFLALAIVAAFALGIPALAAQTKPAAAKADHAHGTITAWDEAGKTFKVKDKNGKEWDFSWNEQTKLNGAPKVGDSVSLVYTKDKDGKAWANHITVGKTEAPKAPAKKP
jgi:hypothetical protein